MDIPKLNHKDPADHAGPLEQQLFQKIFILNNLESKDLFQNNNWLIVQLKIMDVMEDGLKLLWNTLKIMVYHLVLTTEVVHTKPNKIHAKLTNPHTKLEEL